MSEVMNCDHGNKIPQDIINSLETNQGGVGRHKCVVCAYSIGLKDGQDKLIDFNNNDDIEICKHNRKAIKSKIKAIAINQKPNQGRHKCAVCAYSFGYAKGMGEWEDNFDLYHEDELPDTEEIYNITQFGTSADISTIYNRLEKGKYYVPSFQRDYVWDDKKASKLIESIIMGLPIPAIFLAKDDERYYIVDGQQRLTSIQRYYNGLFALSETFSSINRKKYDELEDRHKDRLDEYSLQLIMIRQETPDDNNDSIYRIFERINTKGTKLSPQEIRTASYNGDFQLLLSEFVNDKRWIDFIKTKNTRKTHEELLLRFFALYFDINNYKAPMKHFLNIYMSKNRKLRLNTEQELNEIFDKVFDIVDKHLSKEYICLKDSSRVNTQLLDSILIGISKNIENSNLDKDKYLTQKINELKDLIDDEEYDHSEYWESRASKSENIKGRCNITIKLFGN